MAEYGIFLLGHRCLKGKHLQKVQKKIIFKSQFLSNHFPKNKHFELILNAQSCPVIFKEVFLKFTDRSELLNSEELELTQHKFVIRFLTKLFIYKETLGPVVQS